MRRLALCLALLSLLGCHRGARRVRIAAGLPGGTFLPLATQLADAFRRDLPGLDAQALEVPGGEANLALLANGGAELALVSNHLAGGASVRLIAPLYEETLQVVVRRDARIAGPADLRGKRIAVGPVGSGTDQIARQVLGHFGLDERGADLRHLTPVEAKGALERGELDAAFIVAGLRTPVVDELLRRPELVLLSLGDGARRGSALDGIRIDAPYLHPTVIPQLAYGAQPIEPVGTIGVKALLVARADLDPDLVEQLTRSLFEGKTALLQQQRLLSSLTEKFDPLDSPFAVHDGADRYFRREEPSFLSKHADDISLAITVGALIWSALTALRAWRRRGRKSRIEHVYRAAKQAGETLRAGAPPEDVRAAREALAALRARAFDDLIDERLDPNEAYLILQRHLDNQLAEAERLLAA